VRLVGEAGLGRDRGGRGARGQQPARRPHPEFVLLYGVKMTALDQAAADITAALAAGELTELPVLTYPLADIAAAHQAAETGAVGKVIVTP
jgi:NADPH:quinone reductase-like Zn-dependent oxidoreductase